MDQYSFLVEHPKEIWIFKNKFYEDVSIVDREEKNCTVQFEWMSTEYNFPD